MSKLFGEDSISVQNETPFKSTHNEILFNYPVLCLAIYSDPNLVSFTIKFYNIKFF